MSKKNTFDKKADEELNQTGEFADNRDIFSAVEMLSASLQDIMTYCDNPSGAGFALKYFISSFFSNAYVIENLMQQVGEAHSKNESGDLRRLQRRAQYVTLNKAFYLHWNDLARAWDKFLEENNLSTPDFPDSAEIVKQRRNYTTQNRQRENDELSKTIMFELTNII
jgi:hypothetical protein